MSLSPRALKLLFLSFSAAQLISLLGDRLHQFSVIGMIGQVAPGSSLELFQFSVFTHLPIILFAPIIGSIIDRSNKAVVLVVTDIARGLLVLGIPWLFGVMDNLYAFYLPVFFLSILNLAFAPAKSALIPEVFGTLKLLRMNAILWTLGIVGTLAGFLLGGWLFDYYSWELSFYVDGWSYLVSVLFLVPLLFVARRVDSDAAAATTPTTSAGWASGLKLLSRSIHEGYRLIRQDRNVAASLGLQAGLFAVLGVLYVVGIAQIQTVFPPEKTLYLSILGSAGMIGMLGGAGLAAAGKRVLSSEKMIAYATIVFALAWVGVALTEKLLPMILWVFVMGLAFAPPFIVTETLLQLRTPEAFRGRVFAAREIVIKIAFLGASLLATLADAVVSKSIIMISVGLLLAVMGIILARKCFQEFRIVSQDG